MNKKGSLELSIQAIVIIVIAFVVLGLILTFVRLGVGKSQEGVLKIIDANQLENPATASNPLTVGDVSIKRNNDQTLVIGYYNSDSDAHKNVKLKVDICIASKEDAKSSIKDSTLPTVESLSEDVEPSTSVGFTVLFKENGLLGGSNYICKMVAESGEGDEAEPVQSKQFTLRVTS